MRTTTKDMMLALRLYNQVKNQNDLTSLAIVEWIKSKKPTSEIFKTLYEQAQDNEKAVIGIISENILKDIRKTVLLSK